MRLLEPYGEKKRFARVPFFQRPFLCTAHLIQYFGRENGAFPSEIRIVIHIR